MARLVFMGTPEFAVPSLRALAREHEVVLVVTQPDRPRGRGRVTQPPPVKVVAEEFGLPVWQPETMRGADVVERLREAEGEVFVVAAFGHILPADVLDLPAHGCLNLHASLLPRWRGAAPIAAAILAGDQETGVTLMLMDEGMDTGPILAQRAIPIEPEDTAETLGARLADLAAEVIVEYLPRWLAGELEPRPQPEEGVTYCRMLRKQDGRIDWQRPAEEIARQIRAYTPWPGTFTLWQGQRLNILKGCPVEETVDAPPGTVVQTAGGVGVVTGKGVLLLEEVQLAGKRPMSVDAFFRGRRDFVGSRLES